GRSTGRRVSALPGRHLRRGEGRDSRLGRAHRGVIAFQIPVLEGRMRTALIVGAGIGGLAAGIALRQIGWQVRIFERTSSPRELVFGLAPAPNAIAALRELGIADTVVARGFEPTCGQIRRMDGTVLKRAEFPPRDALGGPMVMALRPGV